MNLKSILIPLLLAISANIALSQINTFPSTESFEQSFTTGTDVVFITNWTGNDVRSTSRIFQGSDARTGSSSINIIPTSSFNGEVLISLDLTGITNPKMEFYAFSKQNGSSTSTRPATLNFSTSIDGGSNFLDDVDIGDETTFPNDNTTSYTLYEYELPVSASGESNVIIKMTVGRGSGSGSVAEFIMDDVTIDEQLLALDISSVTATNSNSLVVTFNQEVTQATAEAIANYSIDNGISVTAASRTAVNEVTLTTTNMANNTYALTANNVEDAASNTPAVNLQDSFTFAEALSITSTTVIDKNTLELIFNLDLDETSAETAGNYSIDNAIGNPTTAVLDGTNAKKVTLTLASDLTNNSFTLTVDNVQDNSTLSTASGLTDTFSYLPLDISAITANSSTEVQVTFNQDIEATSAAATANYSLNFGFGAPASAVVNGSDASIVTLTFSDDLVNNTYTLTINNVTNLSGNAQANGLTTDVTFTTATLTRQIVINEIFADPTGASQPNPQVLPSGSSDEFIELYNASSKDIDLGDFDLTGGTVGDFVLAAGSYVILTPSSSVTDYQSFGDVVAVTSWNGLSNGGEQIILKDNLGNIVDSLTYDQTWYQDDDKSDGGWSIEQINPELVCSDANNWAASVDTDGATPGAQNSIFDTTPDTAGPNLISVTANSDQELVVTFNEIMDASSLTNGTYTLDNGITVSGSTANTPGLRSVTLTLGSAMSSGTIYTLTVTGTTDCAGNTIDTNQLSFLFDDEPPVFQRFVFKDTLTVDLIFDEELAESIAETESNFSLNQGIGNPDRNTLNTEHATRVSLEFDQALTIGTSYDLTFENLTDTLGNTISLTTEAFDFSNAIDTVIVISSQLLDVYFTEAVETSSAEAVSNYEVDNSIGNPKTALQDDDNTKLVHLVFETGFNENRDLLIGFEDIKDDGGDFLQLLNTSFVYDTDRPGVDIVEVTDQNTLLVSFDEALDLTSAEAINNYTVNNDIGQPVSATLQPNEQSVELIFASAFENEVENTISIKGIQDLAMNEITTTRNIDFTYDVLAPRISSLLILSPTQLQLTFSEQLDETIAETLANYTIDNGIGNPTTVTLSARNTNEVVLEFTSLGNNASNTITISALEDVNGNALSADLTNSFATNEVSIGQITALTDSTIQVQLSKTLTQISAETTGSYSFDNGLTVKSVVQGGSDTFIVLITFNEKMSEGVTYQMDIQSLQDTDGNTSTNLTGSFSYDSEIASIMVINENTIRLNFDNALEAVSAQTVTNYTMDNGLGNPISAVLNNDDQLSVTLIFSADLMEGVGYMLDIENLRDSFGDLIATSSQSVAYDITPPSVLSVSSTFTNQITVTFDEALDQTNAEILNHYTLDNGAGSPTSAVLSENQKEVLLTFSADLTDNTVYELTVDRVEDLNGNSISNANSNFTFEAPVDPSFRDLVINEIYPDPDTSSPLPNAEFVEIFNAGTETIKLQDFEFTDNSSTATLSSFDLAAGAYLILTSSSNADLFSGSGDVMGLSNFPSLSNTGETLYLKRRDAQIVDSLQYDFSFYNDEAKQDGGYTIELINPETPCFDTSNYTASTDANQGTPGVKNSVFDNTPDTTAPELSSLEVISDQQLRVTFNESMDVGSIAAADFSISGGVTVGSIDIEDEFGTMVLVNLSAAFERGTEFTLTVADLSDCAGNSIVSTDSTFFLGATPAANEVIITEIMANPSPTQGLPEVEYIEVFNASGKILTLDGLTLSDLTGTTNLPDVTFAAGEYLVLTSTGNTDEFTSIDVGGVGSFPSLNTSGDSIAIADASDNLIFDVVYSTDFYGDDTKAAGGFSLEMINPEAACFDDANWTATTNSSGGTPGIQNSVFDNTPDTTAPELSLLEVISDQQLRVTFNESMDVGSIATADFSISGGVTVSSIDIEDEFGTMVLINLAAAFEKGTEFTLTVVDLSDCAGNTILSVDSNFFLGASPAANEVIITEIMANPSPTQGLPEVEYIEVFNASSKILTLDGLTLSDLTGTTNLPDVTFAAGEYLVLTSTGNTDEFAGIEVGGVGSFPSLNTSGDSIAIADASDNLIFDVVYSIDFYGDDTKAAGGFSLEMINPEAACFDNANWTATNNSSGGTPGVQNSVFDNTPDTTAPELSSLEVISDQQLRVTFNESMDVGSIAMTDFSISGGVTVSSIDIEDEFGTMVLINLAAAFEKGTEFTLTVADLSDCAGNTIVSAGSNFFLGATPAANEVIITEIMANPSPTQGLPEVEYIEVYNASSKILTLDGLTLSDLTGTTNLPDVTFAAGEYLVLTSTGNSDEFAGIDVGGVSSFPSLNTSGDSIAIADASDNLIFDVVYSTDFYGDDTKAAGGFSLEMINPEAACFDDANWTATTNTSGGTPGVQNSVFDNTPDTTAPELSSLEVISDQQLRVTFNESMDVGNIATTDFSISGGVTVSSIDIEDEFGTMVLINLAAAFEKGTEFTLTVVDLSDCAGNTILSVDSNFFLGASPAANEVIITEIMANPSPTQGLPEVEYIEVFNASSKILTLDGLTLSDLTGTTNLPDVTFAAGEYLVLTSTGNTDEFAGIEVGGVSSFPSLNTSGDSIAIADASDNLIFDVVYSIDFYGDDTKAAGGFSLEMINPEAACFDNANWTATNNSSGGTPGVQNSVFDNTPDTTAPELSSLEVISDQQLRVTFNESMDVGNIATTDFSISGGVTVSSIDIEDEFGTSVLINLTTAFERGTEFTLTTSGINDCAGNTIVSVDSNFFLGATPAANEVIITEIMANPSPTQGLPEVEYIEVYNASSKILTLNGLTLSDLTGTTNLPDVTFAAGDYVVLTSTGNADEFTGIEVGGVSSFPSLNTSGDSIAIADASDNLIFDVVYDIDFYGDDTKAAGGFSLEMINPEAACFDDANWTATNDSSGGTPGVQNSVFDNTPDTTAPELSSLEVISDQQLRVTFNESMDVGNIATTDFSISGGVTVSSIDIEDEFGTIVLINLAAAFEKGTEFTLTVADLSDCAGNTIVSTDSTFFLGATPAANEVIITEIMANPSPTQGLPEVEYIEVFNASGKILTLDGLTLSDLTGSTNLPAVTFAAGEYLVLTSTGNTDEFAGIEVGGVGSFPSLNTSGDSIAIADASDNLIFDVVYSTDFYGDDTKAAGGFSLEMINPEAACFDDANWTATTNSSGGTPGIQNSVFDNTPDTTAPELSLLEVISDQQLRVTFNESMDVGSIAATDFSISGGVTVSSIDIEDEFGTMVLINLTSAFERGTEFTLTTSGINDCAGNAIVSVDSTFFLGATPAANEVIITEIMANPSPTQGLPEVEYIEVYNASSKIITLDGLTLSDLTGTTNLPNLTFAAGEYVVLTSTGNADEFTGIEVGGVSSFPSLNTSGDSIAIADASANLIFDVVYDIDFYGDETKAAGGFSLEMINPEAACFNDANWTATNNTSGGTPGVQNSVFDNTPDTTAPELSSLEVISDQKLRVTFNESMDVGSIAATDFGISGGVTVSSIDIEDEFGTNVLINLTTAFERGTEFTLTTSGVNDCAGNTIVSTDSNFFLGATPTANEVIITEIMANPSPTQGLPEVEYIEVYNASSKILTLDGLTLSDLTGTTNLPDVTFAAGEYLVLTSTGNADEFTGIEVGGVSSFPSLNTSGDSIAIADASDNLIFDVVYSTDFYGDDTKAAGGFSLEMINPEAACFDDTNWTATNNASGGTPGIQNSIFDNTPDTTAPELASLEVISDQQLRVTFNESMDVGSIATADFSISGGVTVSDIDIEDEFGTNVLINLTTAFERGTEFTLTTSGVNDCAGNTIVSTDSNFFLGATPTANEVIITEIMANPSPTQGLPEVEYIEVYNASSKILTLDGLTLSDLTGTTNLPDVTFAAGEYLVLTSTGNADEFTGIEVGGVSSFPSLNTSGDSIAIADASDNLIFDVVYDIDFYGDDTKAAGGFSLEMINPEAACFDDANWTATTNSSGGTPGIQNSVFDNTPDTTTPELSSLEVISDQQLRVTFNESMDVGSITATDFGISGGVTVSDIEIKDEFGIMVLINLTAAFGRGTEFTLTVADLSDCAGNVIVSVESNFFLGATPAANEVIITEIMANPSPTQGLPEVEYIEVYNASGKILTLDGLTLSDLTGSTNLPAVTFAAGEYVVLTSTGNADEFTGIEVGGVSSFPSLNTSGDSIAIADASANLIFDVVYDIDFYGDETKAAGGFSLEMINPEAACFDDANWTATNNTSGGTPGVQNSVFNNTPDTTAPELSLLEVISDQQLRVTFNESMDVGSIAAADFGISGGVTVSNIEIKDEFGSIVLINLTNAFARGTEFALNLSGLTDCSGNEISATQANFFLGAVPTANELIITEIMANPAPSQGLPEVEYIEVLNVSGRILSLQGIALADRTTSTILPAANIAPGAYAILSTNNGAAQFNNGIGVSGFPSLNTSGDQIMIGEGANEIFSVSYTDDWYRDSDKASGGFSLEMIDTAFPCQEASNWTASDNTNGGTPGAENSVADSNPDIIGPKLIRAVALTDQTLLLTYDERLETGNITNGSFSLSGGINISEYTIDASKKEITLTTDAPLETNILYTVSTENITDCSGNLITDGFDSQTLVIAVSAESGDILINEILFNPKSGGVRFVELYNNSTNFINLKNWLLAGSNSDREVSLEESIIAPGEYVVLTTSISTLLDQYPKAQLENAIEMSSFPSFPNTEGSASVINENDLLIDLFDYSDDYHSPLLDDVDGVSLERIRFAGTTNDPNNWQSASSTEGFATPGYANSQAQQQPDPGMTVDIEPRTFAPDVAGMANFTTINFEFDNPGNTLNVKIYDAGGNLVKDIAQNALVGSSGFFRWDGTYQNGSKARVGYYMILFEIISPEGNVTMSKERVAIGTRL